MEAVIEEVEVVNSIYEDAVTYHESNSTVVIDVPESSLHVKLWLPVQYPEEPPRVSNVGGIKTDGKSVQKVQSIIDDTFIPGEVYLYTFIDELRSLAESLEEKRLNTAESSGDKEHTNNTKVSIKMADWATTEEIRDHGSVFIGRAIRATTETEMESLVTDLLSDKKLSQATHNMVAWRIRLDEAGTHFAVDYDNDGEAGAGASMIHVLEMANVYDVVVVVTRFYGGIHLGATRFKHIKNCTRDALISGGFINK